MESKLGLTIMETLLRLSALTDTSIFLLVDSPSGRHFCGKEELCQSFIEGQLTFNAEKDVEMRLTSKDVGIARVERRTALNDENYDSSTKRQRLRTPTTPLFNGSFTDAENLNPSTSTPFTPPLKRKGPALDSCPSKTVRLSTSSDEIKIETWDAGDWTAPMLEGAPPPPVSSSTNAVSLPLNRPSNPSQPSQSVKEEIVLNDSDEEEQDVTEASFNLTTFDASEGIGSNVVPFNGAGGDANRRMNASGYDPSVDGLLPLSNDDLTPTLYQPTTSSAALLSYGFGSGTVIEPDEMPEVRMHLRSYLDADRKAAAVSAYEAEAMLVKESPEYRILSSLLYDVGKKYGTLSLRSEEDSLRYFYVCFQEFCNYFPNLTNVFNAKLIIDPTKPQNTQCVSDTRTFKTFMRAKMQRTFGRYSKRHT